MVGDLSERRVSIGKISQTEEISSTKLSFTLKMRVSFLLRKLLLTLEVKILNPTDLAREISKLLYSSEILSDLNSKREILYL